MKALSLFLSVLMAFGCFSIALQNFAPTAKAAAATKEQWKALTTAFEVAHDAGNFVTAGYAVSDDGAGNITVSDTTDAGYYYNIVRALANVAASETDYDHNATLREYIKSTLAVKLGAKYTTHMGNFVDSVLAVPSAEGTGYTQADGVYGWYGDNCWQGSSADADNFAPVTYTVMATRSAKAAVFSDYEDAADVPANVETEYKLTISAKAYKGSSELGSGYNTVWYQNDSLVCSAGMAAAPDVSAIVAYNNYVTSGLFAEIWAEYIEDNNSIYQRTSKELRSLQPDYQPLMTAANTCDADFVEKFIGAAKMAGYTSFVSACYNTASTTDVKAYVDWIKGIPINDEQYDSFDYSVSVNAEPFYRNSRDYTGYTEKLADFDPSGLSHDDVKVMENLITLAGVYRDRINDKGDTVKAALVAQYGYDTSSYDNYIADLTKRISEVKVADIKAAYRYVISNSAPLSYTFPKDSAYYTAESYALSTDTVVDAEKNYYVIDGYSYAVVTAPAAENLSAYYERSGEAEPYTYTLTADTAIDAAKTYYTRGDAQYKKVELPEGNPSANGYYEYTASAKIMAVGNDTYISQPYDEAGQVCPLSSEELLNTYNWLESARSTINAQDAAVVAKYFTSAELAAFDVLINNLSVEKSYRGFTEDHENYAKEYIYFMDLMLNTNPSSVSDEGLWGKAAVADDPTTPDVDETAPAVPGFIETATSHYNALVAAYNNIKSGYSAEIQNRYAAFNAKANAYVNSMYQVLYDRCRSDLVSIVTNAGGAVGATSVSSWGTVNKENFAAVKGAMSSFDQSAYGDSQLTTGDSSTPVAVNARYDWIKSNWSTIKSKTGMTDAYKNVLDQIIGHLMTYKSQCESIMAAKWNNVSTNRNSNASWDNFTGTYKTRHVLDNDMVRYKKNDGASVERYEYTVTDTKIETVITKLDTFLKSDSFIKLIGMDEEGVTDLSSFIENLLVENLFTDKIINTLVALLLPMVCDLIETKITELLSDLVINGVHCSLPPHPGWSAGINIQNILNASGMGTKIYTGSDPWGDWTNVGAGVKNLAGWGDLAFNGAQNTTTFPNEFENLGLNIYPAKFGAKLPASVNGVSMTTFKNALNSAGSSGKRGGGWWYFDTYNQHLFQNADGSWTTVNSATREGYNDNEITADDLAGIQWGVKDYNTFCTALATVFGCIEPLIKCIFTNMTYSRTTSNKFIKAHVEATGDARAQASKVLAASGSVELKADGYGQATLTIAGMRLYENLWAPIFEAMGITGTTGSYTVSNGAPYSTSLGTSANNANMTQIATALIQPVYTLIHTLAQNPIATLCNMLPNLCYELSYNMIQPLLNQLSLNINLLASITIDDIGKVELWGWADFTWLADLFVGNINDALRNVVNTDIPLDLSETLNLNKLLGADLTNLNAILGKFLPDIASGLPAINTGRIGLLGTKTTQTSIRTTDYNGGPGAGMRYYVQADKADVLYDILKWVLELASDEGALASLLAALDVELPAGVTDLLKNIKPEDAIAALVELFLPRGLSGSGYSNGYDMADYNWYRPSVSESNYNLTSSSFVYLKYQNDWTAEKADYIYNHVDEVATSVLELIDEEKAAEFTGISDFVLDLVNSIFNNNGIMNVLDLLMKLGTAAESEDHTIANLVKEQVKVNGQSINIDLRSWYNSFGYLYGEQRVLGDGEFIYTNKDGEYCVGIDGDDKTAGVQPEFVRSYPLAPAGFGGFQKVGGKYVPVASNGAGKRGEVTKYYKYTKNATTKEITYTLTNVAVDNYYVNNYPDLQVALGEKDKNDCYWHWKVKGNSYTASGSTINLANGTWYDLVDGSDNARNVFTAVFCNLMQPVMGVIGLILTGDDLSVFNNALTIKGYNCYDGAIIPVMEILGVKNLKTQAQYNAAYKMQGASNPNANAAGGFYYLVSKLFDALGDILTYDYNPDGSVKKAPVQKLIELLPGIFYFFQSDGLSTLIKNLLMPVWVLVDTIRPIADADLDDFIHQFLCNKLSLSYDKNDAAYESAPLVDFILNLIDLEYIPYTEAQAQKDKNMVDAIYQLTLEDLSLNTVYKVVEMFTGLDLAPLTYAFEGMCAGYTDIKGVSHGVHVDSASAYRGTGTRSAAIKQRYTLDYYGPDIITVTISVLLDVLRYKNNAKALDDLIGLTSDYFETDTLSGMTAEGLLEALTFVFEEKDASDKQVPNWDYLLEQDSIAIRRPTDGYAIAWVDGSYDLLKEFSDMTPYHSIYNLAYKTDWTYDTAKATDEMLAIILDYLTVSAFAKGNDEITSFAGFVDGLLNDYVFSGETLRTIAGLMAQLYNLIPAEIIAMVDALLDVKMTAWLGNDGYDTELVKKDVERTYSDILSNSVIEIDVNKDGEISEDEKFDKYQIKANGTVIDETYVPVAGAKIEKTLMTVDEHGNYEAYKDEDGEKNVSYYIIGEVKTEDEVTSVVWSQIADNNFATDASSYVPNYDWGWWADPTAEAYVDTREEFIDALEAILAPSATLFSFIFLERDYKLLYTAGNDLGSTSDDTDAIILDGVGAYGDAVVPILESLGVPLTKAQYDTLKAKHPEAAKFYEDEAGNYIGGAQGFAPSKYYNASATTNADKYNGELWLSDMMDLFIALADDILANPVNWILNKMPGIIYFINAGGVTASIANLFDDVNDILDTINSLLDKNDRINLGNLAGINLSNLTFAGIIDIIYDFTGIKVRDDLVDYMNNLFIGTLSSFWSANGTLSFTMDYNTEEDKADFITILLSLIVEILEDEGTFIDAKNGYNYTYYNNPMVIDHLINGDLAEDEGGIVTDVLNALRNPESVVYAEIDWNYFDETYNLAENTDGETNVVTTPGFAFQYLNYTTQWTYVSALNAAEGFEDLILGILGIVDADKFGSMTSLGELINMDTVYTAETLQGILDMIAPLLYGEGAILNETLLQVIGAVLGADLTQWNGKYAFANELKGTVAHDDEVDLDYAMMPNYVLTADTELDGTKTYYVLGEEGFEAVAAPDAEALNEYYEYKADVKTYLIKDDETFGAGLALILRPAEKLLSWLLFGDDYTFFNGNTDATADQILLTIQGSHGYKEGLALLLEALGFNGLKKEAYYIENGMSAFIKDLVASVIDRLNSIIADPVNEIVALIPELIYFINANGLAVSIQNLLAGPLTLVNQFASLLAEEGEEAIYDPNDPNKVVNDLIEGVLQDALGSEEITFALENVNLGWVMELAEALTGMEITDILQNSLDNFYIGKLNSYSSKSEKLAYKMSFDKSFSKGGNGDFADFITILLSFVIDIATYPGNANALVTLLNGDKTADDSGYIDPNLIQGILDFIKDGYVVTTDNIDWFYFDEAFTIHTVEVNTENGVNTYTYTGTPVNPGDKVNVPERTINYLTYASDWTEDTAEYIVANRNEIVAAVLEMAGLGSDASVADIIKGVFDPATDLYTGETLNKIFDLIAPVLSEIPEVLLNLANIVLDIDLSFYADMNNRFDEEKTYTRQEFVNGLCEMISPLSVVLDWLLFGKDIRYFDKKTYDDTPAVGGTGSIEVLVNLPGAEGYKYGLIPILEALGVDIPAVAADDTFETVMFVLVNNVLARVEAILANPVDEVLELLPNLLYFINTNGLAVCINNLLAGVFALLDAVNEALPAEDAIDINALISGLLNGLPITVDLKKLDLMAIVTILEELTAKSFYAKTADTALDATKTYYVLAEKENAEDEDEYVAVEEPKAEDLGNYYEVTYTAGVKIADVVTKEKLERFYLGQLEYFTSANGQAAYRMVYDYSDGSKEGMKDMLTVIANFAVELLLWDGNAEAIDAMINGVDSEGKPTKSTVKGIVDIILGLKSLQDVEPADINWNYFDETVTLGAITVPQNAFVYLDYCNEWTYERAVYFDTGIENLVNEILALTTAEGETPKTINDLVDGLVDLDELLSADLLNRLLDLVAPLLYGEDSFISEYLLNLIGFVLGADLTQWNYEYRFEALDETKTYGDDPETGLKYRAGEFTVGDTTYTDKKIFAIKDAADFSTGLAYVFAPASRLLGWLLLGQDYGFFVDDATGSEILLTVPGFNGYDSAIVLLLEALGCKNANEGGVLKTAAAYKGNEDQLIKDVIDALLARVDEILADPIDEILGLIPEIIYFINAGGLNAVVQNLAGGILAVVDYVNNSGLLAEPIAIDLNDIVSGAVNEAYAKMKGIEVEEIAAPFVFDLETVTIQTVIDIAEMFTGLDISGAIGYTLEKFALGEVVKYNSVTSSYNETYKMRFAATGDGTDYARDRADMITIVISLVLDILRYKDTDSDNAAALAELLKDVMDGKITVTVIDMALEILNGCTIDMMNIDWFYPITEPAVEDITTVTDTTEIKMVERTINYLSYNSDWTEEKAEYIIENLDEIIAEVLALTGSEDTTVAAILEKSFKLSDLYTAENLNKLVETIKGLVEKLGVTLTNLAGMILADNDALYEAYASMSFTDDEITDRTTFANGLAEVIAPIGGLLDWILFGKDLAYFYDNDFYGSGVGSDLLKLSGAEGYAYGLVPMLEALGVENLPAVDENTTTNDVLAQVVDAVLDRAEAILADPVNKVIDLLPNLLYFINANGLAASVNNLLACLLGVVEEANPLIKELDIEISLGDVTVTEIDVNTLVNGLLKDTLNGYDEIDVKSLKLLDIVKIVEAVTGLKIADVVTADKIENFYLGEVTYFRSSNGKAAFKMGYTDAEGKHDMLTILLNLVVEILLADGNAEALDALLGKEVVAPIVKMIKLLDTEAIPGDFHWGYFNEDADDTEISDNLALPKTPFINHLAYTTDWTQNFADTLYDNLDDIVTAVLTIIAGDDETKAKNVSDLINGSFTLYKAEYLNSILDLTAKLYELLDDKLLTLAGLMIDCDLTQWEGLKFADEEVYDHDTFLNCLVEVLEPISGVLDWLLFGNSYNFFVDNATGEKTLINIGGAYGYLYGLAPIFIALGVELPNYAKGYGCMTEVGGQTFLKAVLDAVLDRVDAILADPVDEVLDLLPGLLYFINANGVSTAAYNLAGGVLNAVNVLVENGILDLGAESIEEYVLNNIGLDIKNLDLEGIIKFLGEKVDLKGIEIYDVFMGTYTVDGDKVTFAADTAEGSTNILEKFYIGEIEDYAYAGINGHKMVNKSAQGRGDIITMLLSIVLDVLFYDGNEDAIAALVNDLLGDDVTFTTENYVALKALLLSGADFETTFGADWTYFLDLSDAERQAKIEAILSADVSALPELPERTQHYLEYDNNWNVATVNYLDENINDIVDLVIAMISNNEFDTLEGYIAANLDIYTNELAQKILDKVAGLISKLDEVLTAELKDKLLITAGSLLGADIAAVIEPVTEIDDDAPLATRKAQFVAVLVDRFGELDRVLDWLLFGEDLTFFTKLADAEPMITIKGGEGYKYGLAPILAALGVDTEITAENCADGTLEEILTNVADRIDTLIYGANGAKTLDEVLALLPELIYFINTGAISECVMNLLQPADELLVVVNENLGNGSVIGKNSVNDLITDIDLANIDFDYIFDLVADKTGIDIANSTGTPAHAGDTLGTVGDYIKTFYFGQLESYTSYDGVKGVRMNYTAEDTRMDMLTILVTLVLDVATSANNKDALVDLLGSEETYNVILALLTGGEVEIEYQKFSWILTEYAGTGKVVSPMTANGEMVRDFLYGPLYTRAMGEYMTKYLQLLIDTYITLLGVQINGKMVFSIEDILNELVGANIYKNDYITAIYDALVGVLGDLKNDTLGEELYNHIANVLKSSLGVDLNYWFTEYTPKTITEGSQEEFINEICRMLRPAYPILKWLLTADKIALFNKANEDGSTAALDDNDYIYIQGAEGYKYAIVPILEALNNGDTSNIMTPDAYIAAVEASATGDELLKYILKPILDKVDGILEDPINGALNLLPAVVYFINSNGLDTSIKNLLGSVFMLLNKIDPLIANVDAIHDDDGTLNLYKLIGIDLKNINFNELFEVLLAGVEEDTGLAISDAGADLVKELTLGVVEEYNSYINSGDFFQAMFTMKHAENGAEGDQVDFVTLILRFVLKFISTGNNAKVVEALLKDSVTGDGYTFLCSLLDNFAQMASTEDGMDKIMYTVYYIFYGALVSGVAVNNKLAEFNGNYSFLNQLFATSDVAFLRQIEKSMGDWLNKWSGNDIVDEDEVIPNGQISFWEKIIEFFNKIINFFKNLFKR